MNSHENESSSTIGNNSKKETEIRRLIGISVISRTISDTGNQIFNPFLPFIAAGLNISMGATGQLLSLRSIAGLLSPVFGSIADRRGYRGVLCTGLVLMSIGTFLVGISTGFVSAAIAVVVWGVGAAGFRPSLHAYLGTQLPYDRRARGIGIVEYAWAFASIFGLCSMGLLIAATSWRMPFFVLSGGLATMAVVFGLMPVEKTHVAAPRKDNGDKASYFDLGPNGFSAYATMIAGALAFFGAMQVFIAHGEWLNIKYGVGPAGLGIVAMVLGVFDLSGSVSVSLFTDRIGKLKSVVIGCVGSLLGYIVLPFLDIGLVCAVLGMALVRVFFEFSIVSNIALVSEQIPEQRGKVMTLGAAVGLVGFTIAATTGPWLFDDYGITGVCIVSGIATLIASVMYAFLCKE